MQINCSEVKKIFQNGRVPLNDEYPAASILHKRQQSVSYHQDYNAAP
jgi:hypothetical protein